MNVTLAATPFALAATSPRHLYAVALDQTTPISAVLAPLEQFPLTTGTQPIATARSL